MASLMTDWMVLVWIIVIAVPVLGLAGYVHRHHRFNRK